VFVTLLYNHQEINLLVRDTGPGISEYDLPYLFTRYIRSEHSTGIGLGLEFARAAIEAHRGSILARNSEEGGAEFVITLPGTLRAA
jgi:two-component system sensor histidine kinase MprB